MRKVALLAFTLGLFFSIAAQNRFEDIDPQTQKILRDGAEEERRIDSGVAPRKSPTTSRALPIRSARTEDSQSSESAGGGVIKFLTVILSILSVVGGVTILERRRLSALAHNLGFGGSRAS